MAWRIACVVAMEMAEVSGDDIGYVNAHGTGTPLNDVAETNAYGLCLPRTQTSRSRLFDKILFRTLSGRGWSDGGNHRDHAVRCGALLPTLRLTDPIESPGVNWLQGRSSLPGSAAGNVGFGWVWWKQHGAHIRDGKFGSGRS